jgi:hypothetical protein
MHGRHADLIEELKALRDMSEGDSDTEITLRRMWLSLMTDPAASQIRDEKRWRDYAKFRSEVCILMLFGVI